MEDRPNGDRSCCVSQLFCCHRPRLDWDITSYQALHLDSTEASSLSNRTTRFRNLSGFWLLGLCNNYGYVIMLSAAFDILNPHFQNKNAQSEEAESNSTSLCNPLSTGTILLADILPSLAIKLLAPFFIAGTHLRVLLTVVLSASSYLLTSLSVANWMSFLGVVCAALSSGLGEVTFLGYSSHFETNVVSTWSSGTGGAGVLGALSYAGFTTVLSPRITLQVMLIVPALLAATFWLLLVHPMGYRLFARSYSVQDSDSDSQMPITDPVRQFTCREKVAMIKPLAKYMIPLSLVYFAEYCINQGLFELIYFHGIWLNHKEQYRWYQVVYQIGVFISRSSVNIVKINKLWILPLIQFANLIFLFFVAYFGFVPTIWVVFGVVLFEGFMGGAAYVNTFYKISQEVAPSRKEFSMSVASLGDSTGIALAGAVAVPVHKALCSVLDRLKS